MNVSCPECQSVFRVDPVKVTGANLRARCSICGGLIPVGASVRWADEFPSSMASGAGAPWPAIASTHSTEGVRRSATVSFPAPAPAPTPPAALPLPVAATPVPVAYAPPIVSSPPTVDTTSRDAPAAHELPSSLGTPPARDAVVRDAGAVRVPPFAPPRRPTPVTPAVAMPPLATPSAPPAALAPTLRPPTPAFVPSPALEGLGAPRDAATLGALRDAAASARGHPDGTGVDGFRRPCCSAPRDEPGPAERATWSANVIARRRGKHERRCGCKRDVDFRRGAVGAAPDQSLPVQRSEPEGSATRARARLRHGGVSSAEA
ncbi:MAG: zinc-ribbon domain-containing protein [Gemmatimonadetes bacterium]|nr:zinc-ribbon domain-containing protein [Gemmatimonadota bacterium]